MFTSLIRFPHFYGFCLSILHSASAAMAKVFMIFLCVALQTTHQTRRVDNICSTQHIKRVYLGLEESGVLTAYEITATHPRLGNVSVHECCQLEIVTCPSCIVSLTFRYMNLSCYCGSGVNLFFYNPCRCDYVWITEPPYENSGVSFCKLIPTSLTQGSDLGYKSKTRTVRIAFFYNRAHSHAFTIDYKSKPNRQFYFGSSAPESNLSSGFISSPYFPAAYPRDLIADYVLSCVRGTDLSTLDDHNCRVHLIFTDFQLASTSVLEFYDGRHRVNVVSGSSFRPPVILTSTNSLTVRFYASGQNNLGFKGVYSFISDDVAKKMLKPATDCGGYVDNFGGTITMMNMVSSEVKLYDCIWLIKPVKNNFSPKSHLYLKVTTFLDFVGDAELQVRRGLTSESAILEKLRYPVSQNFKEHVLPLKFGYYVSLRATFSSASHFAITYASFSYNKCFILSEFLCHNYRCISKKLTCDGFDHCGDNSDEPDDCYQEWDLEPTVGRWYTHTPNYYFPKMKDYSDLKTASVVFLVSLIGLVFLISALTTLLHSIGAKSRRERNLQQQFQSISELRDSLSDEVYVEDIIIDDPPSYEAPPNYEDVMKLSLALIMTASHSESKHWSDNVREWKNQTCAGNLANGGEESHTRLKSFEEQRSLSTPSVHICLPEETSSIFQEEEEEHCEADGFNES